MEVDFADDSIDRWSVFHYRYDPERNEVRHVLLKAFSSRREMMKYMKIANIALQKKKEAGGVPIHEHISGRCLEAGHGSRAREARSQIRQIKSIWRRRLN